MRGHSRDPLAREDSNAFHQMKEIPLWHKIIAWSTVTLACWLAGWLVWELVLLVKQYSALSIGTAIVLMLSIVVWAWNAFTEEA